MGLMDVTKDDMDKNSLEKFNRLDIYIVRN